MMGSTLQVPMQVGWVRACLAETPPSVDHAYSHIPAYHLVVHPYLPMRYAMRLHVTLKVDTISPCCETCSVRIEYGEGE
jgi:hypothetical protein